MRGILHRNVDAFARELLENVPALIIEGARQVGKTTLAKQLADDNAIFLNLDDEQTRAAADADPAGFVRQGGQKQLVLDELQRKPELTLALKSAIDEDRRPSRFIVTGSASLLRVKGLSDSLAGRAARLNMFGLSQGELVSHFDDWVAAVKNNSDILISASSTLTRLDYAQILAAGSYPELRASTSRVRGAWFDSYVKGVVNRDLVEFRRQVSPARSFSVLKTLAGRQAGELVKARLSADTGVPAGTISGYLDLLSAVGLIHSIPPWTPNLAKREIGKPKVIVTDSGLAMRLDRLTASQLEQIQYGEAFGSLLEGFVIAELLKQQSWSEIEFELFHYRSSVGEEVDLIIELDDGSIIGIEVKSATSFTATQFKGLVALREKLGDRFRAGVVLNTSQTGYRYADRLYGAPISTLWTL